MNADPKSLRKWVKAHQRADAFQAAEFARERKTPEASWREADQLIHYAASLHGWPLPRDVVEDEEDMRVYEAWARLRRHFGAP